jgi:hypothetical protein
MRVLRAITQRRLYPNDDPAAILVAQFPGSMNPTVTKNPGPRKLRNLRRDLSCLRRTEDFVVMMLSVDGTSSWFKDMLPD